MSSKKYDWPRAKLEPHSHVKFNILRRYFREYLQRRCLFRHRESFRIAVVDGFCGGGRYRCETEGSPLIFLDELLSTFKDIQTQRAMEGSKPLRIECYFWFNDTSKEANDQLGQELSPYIAALKEEEGIKFHIRQTDRKFQDLYPDIEKFLDLAKFKNVFFNLDQCGNSLVSISALRSMLSKNRKTEVLLTFAIKALRSYYPKDELAKRLQNFGVTDEDWYSTSEKEKLGILEAAVFDTFKSSAPYVSPFSVNSSTGGWRYWMLHFAGKHTARSVYNDVLHQFNTSQTHYGRFGLNMLKYDQREEAGLYNFKNEDRQNSLSQLPEDIARVISEYGDALLMDDFYEIAYKETPAHSEDIQNALFMNSDVQVFTKNGGQRRKSNSIRTDDVIKLAPQRTFSFIPKITNLKLVK